MRTCRIFLLLVDEPLKRRWTAEIVKNVQVDAVDVQLAGVVPQLFWIVTMPLKKTWTMLSLHE
jgi:hypothetical protein